MPLPLPQLDDRRWADLVDEGRALIQRYAPQWTDHNVSDPGITLLDLLAWVVEADLYRVNRVTDRHRRKFLSLVGLAPAPPHPARATVTVVSRSETRQRLPRGTVLRERGPAVAGFVPFRLDTDLTVTGLVLAAVQVDTGADSTGTRALLDRTELNTGSPVAAWGEDPRAAGGATGPALLLGLDSSLTPSAGDELTIAVQLTGSEDPDRQRDQMARAGVDPRLHHGCRSVWEWYDGSRWQTFASPARDETRALSVSGAVRLSLPAAWPAAVVGTVPTPLRWLRCRLAAGRPDSPPSLRAVGCDAVVVTQAVPGWSVLRVAAGVDLPSGPPVVGTSGPASIAVDRVGRVTAFAQPRTDGVPCTVLGWRAPNGPVDGELTVDVLHLGPFAAQPHEAGVLPGGPVLAGTLRLTTTDADGGSRTDWSQVADFDAAARTDPAYTVDAPTATIVFGDGDHGRVPSRGHHGWVATDRSAGAAGTPGPLATWELAADDPHNAALLPGVGLGQLRSDLAMTVLGGSMRPGGDAQGIDAAESAAAEDLWVHERVLELAQGSPPSLDQVSSAEVLARAAPTRATTLLDFERLARAVPGTDVARARAWTSLDVGRPCLAAIGTVTVVVVPRLPAARPEPTPGLLRVVRAFLSARRVLGTRLVVVGPQYVEVTVTVRVAARPGAVRARLTGDVLSALNEFLDPLTGGPAGLGWPFGRDVARSEILQVVDSVTGVDYVDSLEMAARTPGCPAVPGGCGNVAVAPTMLVASGSHRVEVTA